MDKIWEEMYNAAKAVQNKKEVNGYFSAGEVSAAVLSSSGKIYTGVCIDTCSGLGVCAERNAIFNMITNGEYEISRVIALMPDGSTGAPCGACRELMVQLMAGKYSDVEIMLDYKTGKTVKLSEITPEWWIS
ncbi:MAG: cytidine deaminase [Ruminococcus sp.]|nr:cytidine deaminase [Ruminococcus sp.]